MDEGNYGADKDKGPETKHNSQTSMRWQGSSNSKGSKTAERMLNFEEMDLQTDNEEIRCVLQDMELEEGEDA